MWTTVSTYGLVILGIGAALFGVAVIWWALFADRARGRRRCPACWHDLSHTSGLMCPECGRTARSERQFFRTRRRWTVAVAALAVLLTAAVWTRMRATAGGWASLVPSPALAGMATWLEPPGAMDEGWRELRSRIRGGSLSPGTQIDLARSVGEMGSGGLLRSAPQQMLVDILNRDPEELLPNDGESAGAAAVREKRRREYHRQLDDALAELPFGLRVTAPKAWANDIPFSIAVEGNLWAQRAEWRTAVERATVTPIDKTGADTGAAVDVNCMPPTWLVWNAIGFRRSSGPMTGVLPLCKLPEGRLRLDATIVAQTRRWMWDTGVWSDWTDAPTVQLQQVVDCGPATSVARKEDKHLEDVMRASFASGASTWEDDKRPVGVRFNAEGFVNSEYADVLVGVTVDLVEHGQLRRRNRFWWRGGQRDRDASKVGWLIEVEDLEACKRLRDSAEGWTLRVTGDRDTALRALPRDAMESAADDLLPPTQWRIWTGTIEQPLTVYRSGSSSPDRIWRVEPRDIAPVEQPPATPSPATPSPTSPSPTTPP